MNPVLKRTITGLTVASIVILAILWLPAWAISALLMFFGVLAVLEYNQLLVKRVDPKRFSFLLCLVAGVAVLLTSFTVLVHVMTDCGAWKFLYLIAIVKISDMGGFAFGLSAAKFLPGGTHRLCPTISPNKSWEGLFGSVFGSCLVSCAFMSTMHFDLQKALLLGVMAALLGTAGDLVESKFKRWVGVKDSSTMKFTNGMGGVLDMFDSLLIAPAAILPLL